MSEFEPGRWADESGEIWVEFDGDTGVVRGVLPIEVISSRHDCVARGTSAGNVTFEASWVYIETLDRVEVPITEEGGVLHVTFGPYRDDDWSVLEVDVCGPDAWPPVWIVFEQSK